MGWVHTDGIKIDTTKPEQGRLRHMTHDADLHDSNYESGITVQASSIAIQVTWAPCLDPLGFTVNFADAESDLLYFFWSIEESSSATSTRNLIFARRALGVMNATGEPLRTGTRLLASLHLLDSWQAYTSGLDLKHNHVYYVTFYVANDAGLEVVSTSQGVRVDTTGPDTSWAFVKDVTCGNLASDTDYARLGSITSLVIVVGGLSDPESGDTFTYAFAFGTAKDPEKILPFSPPQDSTKIYNVGVNTTFEPGILYVATVSACNRVGRCSLVMSDGITFDNSSSEIGAILDGSSALDIDYQSNTTTLCGLWQNISDAESSILYHEVAFGICDSAEILQFVNVGLDQKFCFQELALKLRHAYCITLRTTNGVGMKQETFSDGVTISGPPLTHDASVIHARSFSGVGSLHVLWRGFGNNGAPIVSFTISILAPNGEKLADPISASTHWNFTFHSLNISCAGIYRVEVCAIDLLQQAACTLSHGFAVDHTAPIVGRIVNGPLLNEHVLVQSSTNEIRTIWTAFRDDESGIQGCRWCVGSASGGLCDVLSHQGIGHATWAHRSDLALHHQQVLYITVECANGAGRSSSATSSAILIHTRSPQISVPACISPVGSPCDSDLRHIFTNESHRYELSWGVADSSIKMEQFWAIGTTKGGQEIQNFSRIDTNIVRLPHLNEGTYFISVLVEDELRRTSFSECPPLTIDQSPPDDRLVAIAPKTGSCVSFQSRIQVRYGGFFDGESGIHFFLLAVGIAPGDSSVLFEQHESSTDDAILLALPADTSLTSVFITITCVNHAGLRTSIATQVKIDSTPPIPGEVLDINPRVGALAFDIDKQDHEMLKAFFDPFTDPECPIVFYEVALVESMVDGMSASMDAISWTEAHLHTSMMLPTAMLPGVQYKILVRGYNSAGLSAIAESDGVTYVADGIDSQSAELQPPFSAGNLSIRVKEQAHDFNGWLGNEGVIVVSWFGFRGAVSRFELGLGGSVGDDNVVPFQSFPAEATNVSLQGPFPDGTLHVTLRAWNALDGSVTVQSLVRIDSSPPRANKVFRITSDKLPLSEADVDCVLNSHRDLQVGWEFVDNESGIDRYEVALISAFSLSTNTSITWIQARLHTSMMLSTSVLVPGVFYKFVVRAYNRAQLHSESFSTEFTMVEESFEANVFDGDGAQDSNFITDTGMLIGRVTISNHQRLRGFIRSVECGFGTTAMGMQLQQFTATKISTSSTDESSAIETIICQSYPLKDHAQQLQGLVAFVAVKVTTCWGGQKILVSNGALVDTTPPSFHSSSARTVDSTGRQSSYFNDTQRFSVQHDGIFDDDSGILKYEIHIVSPASNVSVATTQTTQPVHLNANLLCAGTHDVWLRATNGAGLVSEGVIAHFTIDSSPPVAGSSIVTHKPGPSDSEAWEQGCQASTSTIRFSWQLCSDQESPVSGYSYAVVEESQDVSSVSHAWSSLRLATSAVASGLTLKRNSTFRILVRCENAAKLFTEMQSQRIVLTTTAPRILFLEHASAYLSSSTHLTAYSSASLDHGYIAGAECGVGTSPVLAQVDAEISRWKARVTKVSPTHYNITCEIDGIQLLHRRKYFVLLKVSRT